MVSGWWLVVGGWWLVVGGWWLVVSGWWLVVGGWWLVVGGWWLVVSGWWLSSNLLSVLSVSFRGHPTRATPQKPSYLRVFVLKPRAPILCALGVLCGEPDAG